MIQVLGTLTLALCVSDPTATAPHNPLLAAAPADSIFVATCDDPAALRANLLSHQMVRLFDGGSGTPYITAITDLALSEPGGDEALKGVEFAKRFAESFDGPIVALSFLCGMREPLLPYTCTSAKFRHLHPASKVTSLNMRMYRPSIPAASTHGACASRTQIAAVATANSL